MFWARQIIWNWSKVKFNWGISINKLLWLVLFLFSVVLIGGSRSLPLARWLTFGLSCFLSLLYRWWALPVSQPLVCTNRHCPDSRFLNALFILLLPCTCVVTCLFSWLAFMSLLSYQFNFSITDTTNVVNFMSSFFCLLLQHWCTKYNQLTQSVLWVDILMKK